MHYERILSDLTLTVPRKLIIRAAFRETVVACRKYNVVLINYTCSNLGVRILAPLGSQNGNSHKVFVP